MRLSDLRSPEGTRKSRKRIGRGHGSGHVKTSGRGQKGQKARTGGSVPAYFEGGQNRFSQRMPYVGGFKTPFRKEYIVVNLQDLKGFEANEEVTRETLVSHGLLREGNSHGLLKVLGMGKLDRPLKVTAHKISASAREQIEAAGGSVTIIELATTPKTTRSKNPAPSYATPRA